LIDPPLYARTRNYADGALTYLSPYISRGVISTRQVFEYIKTTGTPWQDAEKLIQELAWRDYWQQVWLEKREKIYSDLKNPQEPVSNHLVPRAIIHASTGIEAVDKAISGLYQSGYMHNHMRMYVASICCNIARSHWLAPARWLYAHLLDGDIASNHLSWQWVAGAFSNKKYYANQDNINKFFNSSQKHTFLDVDYESFGTLKIPDILSETVSFELKTALPDSEKPALQGKQTTLIYNYYNLDPSWHREKDVQRILLLEPSAFLKNPVHRKCIDFVLALRQNIPDLKVFTGEFTELLDQIDTERIIYKEHPLNAHYNGQMEPRDWLCSVEGYFPSFFAFWKKCKKELQHTWQE